MRRAVLVCLAGLAVVTSLCFARPSTFSLPTAFTPDPNHNPLNMPDFRGSIYERNYLNRFIGSRSEAETRHIMRLVDLDITDAPARENRIVAMLVGDSGVILAFGIFILFKALAQKRKQIGNAALDAAASTLVTARSVKSYALDIAAEINKRSALK